MITKFTSGLLLVGALAGCTHIDQIPAPNDNWTYCASDENGAEFRVDLEIKMDRFKVPIKRHIFLQSVDFTDNAFTIYPSLGSTSTYLDGIDGSYENYSSSTDISNVTKTGVVVEVNMSCSSSDKELNYDLEFELLVPYTQSGSSEVKNFHYSWQWIKLNPNQHIDLTVKTPVD